MAHGGSFAASLGHQEGIKVGLKSCMFSKIPFSFLNEQELQLSKLRVKFNQGRLLNLMWVKLQMDGSQFERETSIAKCEKPSSNVPKSLLNRSEPEINRLDASFKAL